MPTFYGRETTVQLSVAELGRATTSNPRTQQSLAASESIRNVAQEFARGSKDGTLTETPIYTDDGSHVRFLGKQRDMPFFMVHAGKNFFDLNSKEKRNRRPARVSLAGKGEGGSDSTAVDLDEAKIGVATSHNAHMEPNPNYKPPLTPHALCLTVFLSNSSFFGTKDRATSRIEMNDVKIDVYLNGALCGSHYVPRRYSGEAYTMTEHTVRFTGSRIGRLIEKPWIIVPSGQNPDGSLREYRRGKVAYAGAQQRWNDISDALGAEADKIGRDEKGERPVIGEYLESLAQQSMPNEVEDMQKAGSPKFGILDVVVFWGMGNKNGPDTPYVVEPTPIRNEGFTAINLDQSMDRTPIQVVPKTTDSPYETPKPRSETIAEASFSGDYSNTSPLTLTPSQSTAPNSNTSPSAAPPLDERTCPAPSLEKPVRRKRNHYHDVFTTKQTLCEEMDSIAAATALKTRANYSPTFTNNPRTTRATYASPAGSSPLSSAPVTRGPTPAQTKIVTLKVAPPINHATSSGAMSTPRTQDEKAAGEFRTPRRKRTPAPGANRERAPTHLNADALDRGFVTPALSADCGITYAPGGIVRHVVAARGGVFRERGVVMGARFVVGG